MKIHTNLAPGFPEDFYQNTLEYELRKHKLSFESQKLVKIFYEGVQIGTSFLDIVVEGKIIIELKSVSQLSNIHRHQVLKYLASTDYPIAMLINFGELRLISERILPTQKIQEFRRIGTNREENNQN
jgi:GxxExxY protein